jgi:hypothetical protein
VAARIKRDHDHVERCATGGDERSRRTWRQVQQEDVRGAEFPVAERLQRDGQEDQQQAAAGANDPEVGGPREQPHGLAAMIARDRIEMSLGEDRRHSGWDRQFDAGIVLSSEQKKGLQGSMAEGLPIAPHRAHAQS